MKYLLFTLLLLLSSCSTKREYSYSSVYEGVDLSKTEVKKIPLIDSKAQSNGYGPTLSEDVEFTLERPKKVKALFLFPAAMTSISYLKFVDNLQKYKNEPAVYSGAGFGAVIAAFLAKGLTTDHIEWKLFSLLESLKDTEYYSSAWKDIVYTFLKAEFKGLQLEGLDKVLILPIYDKKLQRIRFLSRGNLYNILLINLELDNTSGQIYQSPVTTGYLHVELLKKNGVDSIAVLNVLGEQLNFFKTNHYLIGLYGKMIGYAKQESQKSLTGIKWFNLKRNNVELDRVKDLQGLQQTTLNKNESTLMELRNFFKKE